MNHGNLFNPFRIFILIFFYFHNLQINLRLILVSGKTKEFLFSPSDSAGDIAQTVFDSWPEGKFTLLCIFMKYYLNMCYSWQYSYLFNSKCGTKIMYSYIQNSYWRSEFEMEFWIIAEILYERNLHLERSVQFAIFFLLNIQKSHTKREKCREYELIGNSG